jgi:hypothetical protein
MLVRSLRFRLHDDALPALDAVEATGARLGVVSNWDCALPQHLAHLGVADRFVVIAASAAVGTAKPDAAIFHHATRLAGVPGYAFCSPQGQSNGQIGAAVQFHFSRYHSDGTPYYDENTQISWDEATNSIVFSGNRVAIALQLASNTWSAPIITPQIYALLPVNGFMNCCTKSSNKFKTSLWNAYDITYPAEIPWQVVSNFKFGKSMRSLKDIIQVESIFTSPIANVPILFGAYKNFDLSSGEVLSSITVPSSSTMITVREYTENLDYDCVACSLSGVVGGQTVHTVMYTVDVHTIERQS